MRNTKQVLSIADQSEYKRLEKLYKRKRIWPNKEMNEICKSCHRAVGRDRIIIGPQLPFLIGKHYRKAKIKILFVGKVLEDNNGLSKRTLFRSASDSINYFHPHVTGVPRTYWPWIRDWVKEINKEIIPDIDESVDVDYFDYVAVSNLIQCGAKKPGSGKIEIGFTRRHFADNCIFKLGIIDAQIRILKPDVVIFLTSTAFDDELGCKWFPPSCRKQIESRAIPNRSYWICIREDKLWISSFHPGRKTKEFRTESLRLYQREIRKFIAKRNSITQ